MSTMSSPRSSRWLSTTPASVPEWGASRNLSRWRRGCLKWRSSFPADPGRWNFDRADVTQVTQPDVVECKLERRRHTATVRRRLLRTLLARTEKALAFNNLSAYVDFFEPHLYYVAPEQVFRFCKEQLSPRVITRHDYEVRPGVLPYEFTTYVYASPIACRPAAAPV